MMNLSHVVYNVPPPIDQSAYITSSMMQPNATIFAPQPTSSSIHAGGSQQSSQHFPLQQHPASIIAAQQGLHTFQAFDTSGPTTGFPDDTTGQLPHPSRAGQPTTAVRRGSAGGGPRGETTAPSASTALPPWRGVRSAPTGKSLFVSKLDKSIDFIKLRDVFGRYGKVISTRVLFDAVSGQSRGIGYVNFDRAEDAAAALRATHGLSLTPGGPALIVKLADDDSSYVLEETTKILARHLPAETTAGDVRSVFERFGAIAATTIHRDALVTDPRLLKTHGLMAYVTFESVDSAVAAVTAMNQTLPFESRILMEGDDPLQPPRRLPIEVKLAETTMCRKHRLDRLRQHESLLSGTTPAAGGGAIAGVTTNLSATPNHTAPAPQQHHHQASPMHGLFLERRRSSLTLSPTPHGENLPSDRNAPLIGGLVEGAPPTPQNAKGGAPTEAPSASTPLAAGGGGHPSSSMLPMSYAMQAQQQHHQSSQHHATTAQHHHQLSGSVPTTFSQMTHNTVISPSLATPHMLTPNPSMMNLSLVFSSNATPAPPLQGSSAIGQHHQAQGLLPAPTHMFATPHHHQGSAGAFIHSSGGVGPGQATPMLLTPDPSSNNLLLYAFAPPGALTPTHHQQQQQQQQHQQHRQGPGGSDSRGSQQQQQHGMVHHHTTTAGGHTQPPILQPPPPMHPGHHAMAFAAAYPPQHMGPPHHQQQQQHHAPFPFFIPAHHQQQQQPPMQFVPHQHQHHQGAAPPPAAGTFHAMTMQDMSPPPSAQGPPPFFVPQQQQHHQAPPPPQFSFAPTLGPSHVMGRPMPNASSSPHVRPQ